MTDKRKYRLIAGNSLVFALASLSTARRLLKGDRGAWFIRASLWKNYWQLKICLNWLERHSKFDRTADMSNRQSMPPGSTQTPSFDSPDEISRRFPVINTRTGRF